jgi:hypothetical protein
LIDFNAEDDSSQEPGKNTVGPGKSALWRVAARYRFIGVDNIVALSKGTCFGAFPGDKAEPFHGDTSGN